MGGLPRVEEIRYLFEILTNRHLVLDSGTTWWTGAGVWQDFCERICIPSNHIWRWIIIVNAQNHMGMPGTGADRSAKIETMAGLILELNLRRVCWSQGEILARKSLRWRSEQSERRGGWSRSEEEEGLCWRTPEKTSTVHVGRERGNKWRWLERERKYRFWGFLGLTKITTHFISKQKQRSFIQYLSSHATVVTRRTANDDWIVMLNKLLILGQENSIALSLKGFLLQSFN